MEKNTRRLAWSHAPGKRFRRAVNRFLEMFDLEIIDTDEETIVRFPQWGRGRTSESGTTSIDGRISNCKHKPLRDDRPNHDQRSHTEKMSHPEDTSYQGKSSQYKRETYHKGEQDKTTLHLETRSHLASSQYCEPRSSRQERSSPPQKSLERRRSSQRKRNERERLLEGHIRDAFLRDQSVTPSESASVRLYKLLELHATENHASTKNPNEHSIAEKEAEFRRRREERESRRRAQEAKYRRQGSTTKYPERREDTESQKHTEDLTGNVEAEGESDLVGSVGEPPQSHIDRSIWIVDEWFEKCNEATRLRKDGDSDTHSMVSVLGGGVMERSAIKVPEWRLWSNAGS